MILGSLGGALTVAAHLGGYPGAALAHLARTAFMSGMDLGLRTGAAVAAAGGLLALAVMPARPAAGRAPDPAAAPGRPDAAAAGLTGQTRRAGAA